jgi:anti-sigma-K factor RskA
MNELEHEQLRSALGAFALNAMEPLEMRRIERHVATCAECAHEVGLLREASAELAWLPSPEDADDLVERISSALPRRPRRVVTRIAVGVAAVSVAVAGLLGSALVRERDRNNDLVRVVATADRPIRLAAQNGFEGRGSVYLSHGRAALILDAMPDPGHGRSYQLCAIKGTKPVSMTVVGGHGRIERAFAWNGRADEFALTIEPAGGSPVPTSNPVLAGA